MKSKEEQKASIQKNIDEYGCHVVILHESDCVPAFCYSIGLYQKYGHPEIICFGLKTELMHNLINDACALIAGGRSLQPYAVYNDFLKSYSVQFIPVDKDYYQNYLGYGSFFYGNSDFPAMQLIWPDKEHHYPWEEEFSHSWNFKQPLLDRGTDFKFYEEKNLAVFTSQQVLDGKPILYVFHNDDGDWQFHSEYEPDTADGRVVCLEEITKLDPSVNQLYHLRYGENAWRSAPGEEWDWDTE